MTGRCLKLLCLVSILFVCISCAPGNYSPRMIQQDLARVFRNTQIIKVEESEIEGVYEVYYNGTFPGIIYYYPRKHLIIFGEIWTLNGESITGKKLASFLDTVTEKYLWEDKAGKRGEKEERENETKRADEKASL